MCRFYKHTTLTPAWLLKTSQLHRLRLKESSQLYLRRGCLGRGGGLLLEAPHRRLLDGGARRGQLMFYLLHFHHFFNFCFIYIFITSYGAQGKYKNIETSRSVSLVTSRIYLIRTLVEVGTGTSLLLLLCAQRSLDKKCELVKELGKN